MRKTLYILIFLSAGLRVFGQDTATVTIYGHINSFTFTAPDGWELQQRSAVEEDFGYFADFYKRNEPRKYLTTLTVRAYKLQAEKIPDEVNKNMEKHMKENGIVMKEEPGNDIKTNEGNIAKVKLITETIGSSKNYQIYAHIKLDEDGVGITLMTRTKEELVKAYKAFEVLVKSCVIRQMAPHDKRIHGN